MEVTSNQCDLIVDGKKKRFTHEIKEISVLKDKILVLLSIPQDDKETIDNIYAVSYDGEIIWRVESLKKLYSSQINLPYEYMTVNGSEIQATDFYGRRYFIDIENGHIKKRDVVK